MTAESGIVGKNDRKKPRAWSAWAFVEKGKPVRGFIGAVWAKFRAYDGPLSHEGSTDEIVRVKVVEVLPKRRKRTTRKKA